MKTAIRTAVLVGLLLHENAIGFAPIVSLSTHELNAKGLTRTGEHSSTGVHVVDFKQRVGSEFESMLTDVQSLIFSRSNETDNGIDLDDVDDARIKLEQSFLASSMEAASHDSITEAENTNGWSYTTFAKSHPNANNLAIASIKTACADLVAQVAVAHTPITEIDWSRTFLFFAFGFSYMGAFQYWYQVNIFKKFFDVDKFTSQSWADKLRDKDGLISLAAQTVLDMTVSTIVYLPTFYLFQSAVFSGSTDPSVWVSQAFDSLNSNFSKDEIDLMRIWGPADLICFSVPLYLRLPSRHAVSFLYITYFSFLRCS